MTQKQDCVRNCKCFDIVKDTLFWEFLKLAWSQGQHYKKNHQMCKMLVTSVLAMT